MLNLNRPFEPHQLILGNVPLRGLGNNKIYILRVIVSVAHEMIIIKWPKLHPPTSIQWIEKPQAVNYMEIYV